MNARCLLLLGSLVLLSACASEDLKQSEALANEQRCCKRLEDLPFTDTPAGKPLKVSVTIDSPSFRFKDGKSFVAPLRLAMDRQQGIARLKTFSVTKHITQESEVYCPKILFLDSDYRVLANSPEALALYYVGPGLIQADYWFSDFAIPPEARFAVLYTPMLVVGKSISYEGVSIGGPIVIGKKPIYSPAYSRTESVPCGQIGELEIEVH